MKEIDVTSLREILTTNPGSITLIDVRTEEEYADGHIPEAKNIPLDTLHDHLNFFNEKKTMYVTCRSGGRSSRAIEFLETASVQAELINVTGGTSAWENAHFELSRN